jgi:hypothetical protein
MILRTGLYRGLMWSCGGGGRQGLCACAGSIGMKKFKAATFHNVEKAIPSPSIQVSPRQQEYDLNFLQAFHT